MTGCTICGDAPTMRTSDGTPLCPSCYTRTWRSLYDAAAPGVPFIPCRRCGVEAADPRSSDPICPGCHWYRRFSAEQVADSYHPRGTVAWQQARLRALTYTQALAIIDGVDRFWRIAGDDIIAALRESGLTG